MGRFYRSLPCQFPSEVRVPVLKSFGACTHEAGACPPPPLPPALPCLLPHSLEVPKRDATCFLLLLMMLFGGGGGSGSGGWWTGGGCGGARYREVLGTQRVRWARGKGRGQSLPCWRCVRVGFSLRFLPRPRTSRVSRTWRPGRAWARAAAVSSPMRPGRRRPRTGS